MCLCQNVLKLTEISYHEHCAYHVEAETLRAWILPTSESVESSTASIDTLPKEELELIVIKMNVITVTSTLFSSHQLSGVLVWLLCGCSVGHITRLACRSVCPSVPYGLGNWKTKKRRKVKIGINVRQGTSK